MGNYNNDLLVALKLGFQPDDRIVIMHEGKEREIQLNNCRIIHDRTDKDGAKYMYNDSDTNKWEMIYLITNYIRHSRDPQPVKYNRDLIVRLSIPFFHYDRIIIDDNGKYKDLTFVNLKLTKEDGNIKLMYKDPLNNYYNSDLLVERYIKHMPRSRISDVGAHISSFY